MLFFYFTLLSFFIKLYFNESCNDSPFVPILFSINFFSQIRNFDTSQFKISGIPKSYKNCKICDFHPNNGKSIPNSSERDVILTIGCGKLTNLLIFVKTLRTTGSKCRFVVFVDEAAMHRYDQRFYTAVENCGVEFINFVKLKVSVDIACVRFRIYCDFLIRNQILFDRVYICDLFDTIVQHDPFTTDFGDMLYLSDEGVKISEDSINTYWISKDIEDMMAKSNDKDFVFKNDFNNKIKNFNILNSGLIAGSINNMIQYCLAMSRMENEKTFQLYAIYDQGFHNIIIYSGFLNGKANYTIAKPNSEMFSTIGVYITRTNNIERNNENMSFGSIKRDGKIPGILHQFDRSLKIKEMLIKSCPNDENFIDYMRDMKM